MPENNIQKYLENNFKKIGTAPTAMSRWGAAEVLKIRDYKSRISVAGRLTKDELAIQSSQNKIRDEHEKSATLKMNLLEKASKGANNLFYFALMPIGEVFLDLFYYHRRPGYSALKILGALLIFSALLVPMLVIPTLSVPIFLTLVAGLGSLLGTTFLAVTGLLSFRIIFGAVGDILDHVYTREAYYLSTPEVESWWCKAGLNEEILKIIKQYLLNAEKQSEHPTIQFVIWSLRCKEFTVPSESSLRKLAKFFIEQLKALRQEQMNNPTNELVKIDIEAVTFILNNLADSPAMPGGAEGTKGMQAEIQAILDVPIPINVPLVSTISLSTSSAMPTSTPASAVRRRRYSTGSILEAGEKESISPIARPTQLKSIA